VSGRGRKWRQWIIGGVAALVLLAVGVPFLYIHFIEGQAPAKLSLPKSTTGSSSIAATGPTSNSVEGIWNVGSGSIVGYRVQETLIGQQSTAVGRTSKVWGSITISGASVTKGSFTANMASVVSDQSQRNSQFDGRIMDVSIYPTATLVLTGPIDLGTVPSDGTTKQFPASGNLTMHGVTKPVSFTVSAERASKTIYVLADIPIAFANWNITNPSIGGFVTTQSTGTLEVLLHLTQSAGNAATTTSPGNSGSGGGGGQITVPSTTVPPLSVPSN
jgi:polyisoprenoid-binding protein YceI